MKKFLKVFFVSLLCFVVPILAFYCINNFLESKNATAFSYQVNICGININGLTLPEAETKINNVLQQNKQNMCLELTYKNRIWKFDDNDFIVKSNVHTVLDEMYKYNNMLANRNPAKMARKIRSMGFEDKIAINYVFVGMDEKLNGIISEIEFPYKNAEVFYNSKTNKLDFVPETIGIKVNKEVLYSKIYSSLQTSTNIKVEIPAEVVSAEITEEILKNNIIKQSSFSTSYLSSSKERKNNIRIATERLNGFKIEPNETFSFNEAVGRRLSENGYKEANIIKDGSFVKGVGGGVCQVSTTLYNALLLANVQITEVHKHTLPVSYVKPALDAMVSWSTADLKFKNTTDYPIFILSSCNGSNLTFSIYGNTKDKDIKIKTRSVITKEIPYEKDEIIPDVQGKYSDKIMFKGEYVRVKYGKNGYEANSYLDYYKNGKLINTKLIRSCSYEPQNGILYEGTDTLPEGMTIPKNNIY